MLKLGVVMVAGVLVLAGCNDSDSPTSPNRIASDSGAQSMPAANPEVETFAAGRCTLQLKGGLRGSVTGGKVVGTLISPDGETVGEITAVQLNQHLLSTAGDASRLPEQCH